MEHTDKEILITGDILLKDIQTNFNLHYPFLKIEFFRTKWNVFSIKNCRIDVSKTLKEIVSIPETVTINIEKDRTIAQIVKDFKEQIGLSLQVFRKSGNVWNVISLTDSWTLQSQNKAGEFISLEMTTDS